MLVDAIRAESYRLSKNRTALFWSLLFVPIIGLVISTATYVFTKANEAKLVGKLPPGLDLSSAPLNMGEALVSSASDFANPAILMFVLIGTLLSWARIVQFTMLGLLAAVVTRSLLAALFAPLVIGIAQFFLPQMLGQMGVSPTGWVLPLLSPGFATDLLKAVIVGGPAAADVPDQAMLKGLIGLVLWTGIPLIGAIAWFNRQDLSKE